MSLGFSISDFTALGKLAWQVYISCKDAPKSFKNISQEVLSLHAVLKEAEENICAQALPATRQSSLKTIGDGCRNVLDDLQSLVDRYESLGTQSKRTWDRMKWGSEDITELRARLTSNILLLTAFISTSQMVVEKKLSKFLQELQDGKHEGSTVTNHTFESLSIVEKQMWRTIRKEHSSRVPALFAWVLGYNNQIITAARQGNEVLVQQLLEKGTDASAKNREGLTALFSAACYGHEAVMRLLVDNGADVNAKYKTGETALHWAALHGREGVLRALKPSTYPLYE